MQGLIVSKPSHSDTEKRPEISPSTLDRYITTVSRISGYVFMAAALGILVFLFI